MTDITNHPVEARRAVRPLSFVAVVVNILVSLGWWAFVLLAGSTFLYDAEYAAPLLAALSLVAAVLDLVIGRWGGRNRILGIVGGCILALPLVLFLLANLLSLFFL